MLFRRILTSTTSLTILFTFCSVLIVPVYGQYTHSNFLEARPYGGFESFKYFLQLEMIYPDSLLNRNIHGVVIINYKIDDQGKLTSMTVANDPLEEFEIEARRLFYTICWFPALQFDYPVDSEGQLEIVFNPKKYKKWVKKRRFSELEYDSNEGVKAKSIYQVDQTDQAPVALFDKDYDNISNYIQKNISYPEAAYRSNIRGKVKLRFVVEPSGNISNLHAIQALGGGCTGEAIRLIRAIHWNPGIRDGKKVRCWLQLDVIFDIPATSR